MIQEYLNKQLISTTDDGNVEKLKKTCAELAKKIAKDKQKILSYSLAAFDPGIQADNPEILEVKNLVVEAWQTFVPNSKDTALTIIRAVMLEALHIASKEIGNACLIWFANRNTFKHFKLGREQDIMAQFMLELGKKIEDEARDNWSFSPEEQIEMPKITAGVVELAELTPHVQANAINASGLAEVINKALKKQASELRESQKNFVRLNALMHMRTQLIWWKEAGHSNTFDSSYRQLGDGVLQLALAFDYSRFIPEVYPTSVDFFLQESHRSLTSRDEKKAKLSDILKTVEKQSDLLKAYVSDRNSSAPRISLVGFVEGIIHKRFQIKQLKSLVGVPDSIEITSNEFALWLFHDLHAIKISGQ